MNLSTESSYSDPDGLKRPGRSELAYLPPLLQRRLAPLRKVALGVAIGAHAALAIFAMTAWHLVFGEVLLEHVEYLQGHTFSGGHLWLLSQYLSGYNPETWAGAINGALWFLWIGFVMGWFLAFARNLFVATWLFGLRIRLQLESTNDFLDQI